VYHRKAAEAKHQHSLIHPGWQYQPRKPSEKKKRMTKNKLAKLAAAKKPAPAPLLTFNEDKSMMSFIPGQGTPSKLTAELEAFNNSKWPAGPPAAFGQLPLPQFTPNQFVTNPVNMDDILLRPGPTTVKNYFDSVEQAAFADPSSNSNYQATLALPALDDFDAFFNGLGNVNTQDLYFTEEPLNAEVLRQGALNEEFKDGLNDFFDFDRFE
jgi:hypothetical protein